MRFLGSRRLTLTLLLVLVGSLVIQYGLYLRDCSNAQAREKWAEGWAKAHSLAHAIEEYCVDFPDAGHLGNDRTWTEKLGGNNPKKIRYLKTERYSRDSEDRLLDSCGAPYVILVKGMPDFYATAPSFEDTEFHVVPGECGNVGIGHRTVPIVAR